LGDISFAEARSIYTGLIARHPDDTYLKVGAAALLAQDGDRPGAIAELRRLAGDLDRDSLVHQSLAVLLSSDPATQEEAWSHYKVALADAPLPSASQKVVAYRAGKRTEPSMAHEALKDTGLVDKFAIRTITMGKVGAQILLISAVLGCLLCYVGHTGLGFGLIAVATAWAAWCAYAGSVIGNWKGVRGVLCFIPYLWFSAFVAALLHDGDRWIGYVAAGVVLATGVTLRARAPASRRKTATATPQAASADGTVSRVARPSGVVPLVVVVAALLFVAIVPTNAKVPSVVATVTRIPVGGQPTVMAVSPSGRYAYVVNSNAGALTVVNLQNDKVTSVHVGANLTDVAGSPDGRQIYVTSNGDNANSARTVYVLNSATDATLGSINVGGSSLLVTFSPSGLLAYVANLGGPGNDQVSVIDTSNRRIVDSIPISTPPELMVVNPNGKTLYAVSSPQTTGNPSTGASVQVPSRLDAITIGTKRVATVDQGNVFPCGLAITPSGGSLYESFCAGVSSPSIPAMRVISTSTDVVAATIDIPDGGRGIAVSADGKVAYVATDSSVGLDVISTATNTVTSNLVIPSPSQLSILNTVNIDPRGGRIYALSLGLFDLSNVGLVIVDLPRSDRP
jgi:YVTN family beta-propeller protein